MSATRSGCRAVAVAGALAAALFAASACDTSPGAAAIVGSHRIAISHVQDQVREALTNPQAAQQFGSNRAEFTRDVLAQAITEDVLADAAAARHVTVTPADVNAEVETLVQSVGSLPALKQQAAQGGVPASAFDGVIRTEAIENKLGDALIATVPVSQSQLQAEYIKNIAQFEQAHVAHILVSSKSLAQRILAKVTRNPSSFAALAKQYSTDTGSKDNGGDLGFVGKGQTVTPFDRAIFKDKIGSYVLVHSQYGWHVIHIIARRTESLAQATPSLKDQLLSQQRQSLIQQAFLAESHRLDIHVNPRYGTWDAAQQAVDATKDPFSVAG